MNTGFGIDYTVIGEDTVSAELLRFSVRLEHAQPALALAAAELRLIEAERFDDEGPGWAPLAASTLEQKAREGYPAEILHRTLALRKSLTEEGGDNIATITDDTLHFGTSDPKAEWHHKGTTNMPARPLIAVGPDERIRLSKIVQRWLVEGIGPL